MSKNTNLSFLTDYITADITNGRIGINNASPAYAFDVTGIARTSTSTYLATASGNVGIGTTSPFSQGTGATSLEINGTNYGQLFVTANSAAARGTIMARTSDVYIASITNSPLLFGTNDTLRLTIASTGAATFSSSVTATNLYSSGNSGIGTSNAQSITNGISLTIGDSATQHQPYLAFRRNSTGGYWAGISWYDQTTRKSFIEENSDFDLRFGTSNTLRMIVTSTGNVGIGTTSPSFALDVASTSADSFRINRTGVAGTGSASSMSFQVTQSNGQSATLGSISAEFMSNWGGDLRFYTKPANGTPNDSVTERMRITSAGNVLVGTTTGDGYKLQIVGASQASATFAQTYAGVAAYSQWITSTGAFAMGLDTASGTTERMRITSGGVVQIGATSLPSGASADSGSMFINSNLFIGNSNGTTGYAFRFDGFANALYASWTSASGVDVGGVYLNYGGTSWTANSDERLKDINSKIENAVDKLKTLRAINYSWKSDETKKENLGLIAQDVEKVFPEVIGINKDGYLGVRYTELIPVLVKAIQELKAEIETLKNK